MTLQRRMDEKLVDVVYDVSKGYNYLVMNASFNWIVRLKASQATMYCQKR